MAKYLGKVKLGSLYHNGSPQPTPTRPWYSGSYPSTLSERGHGDIPMCSNDFSAWTLGNTSSSNELTWIKIQNNGKTLFLCDKVILTGVSWEELNKQGLVTGKKITIDGKEYLCRLLTGGSNYRTGTDSYLGGSPKENEWDRFICNEDKIEGLPTPTSTDLDKTMAYIDVDGEHNQFWNWWAIRSWCKETYKENSSCRVLRGYESPRYFYYDNSDYTYAIYGWRPVLEVIEPTLEFSNIKDTITQKTIEVSDDIGTIENTVSFDVKVTVPETESTSIGVYVDDVSTSSLAFTAGACTAETTKVLSVKLTPSMLQPKRHQILVKVENSSGTYILQGFHFTTKNDPPIISGENKDLGTLKEDTQITYSVTDKDNDPITVTIKTDNIISSSTENITLGQEYTLPLSLVQLGKGRHTIDIIATDKYHTVTRTYTCNVDIILKKYALVLDNEVEVGETVEFLNYKALLNGKELYPTKVTPNTVVYNDTDKNTQVILELQGSNCTIDKLNYVVG